jgi:hypothetical protein
MENDLKSLNEQYHINEIASIERFTPNKSIKCQVFMYKKSYIKMYNYSDKFI